MEGGLLQYIAGTLIGITAWSHPELWEQTRRRLALRNIGCVLNGDGFVRGSVVYASNVGDEAYCARTEVLREALHDGIARQDGTPPRAVEHSVTCRGVVCVWHVQGCMRRCRLRSRFHALGDT